MTNPSSHCKGPAKKPGRCDACQEIHTHLTRVRTEWERRRNLYTIPGWPPELEVKFRPTQPAPLPLFDREEKPN